MHVGRQPRQASRPPPVCPCQSDAHSNPLMTFIVGTTTASISGETKCSQGKVHVQRRLIAKLTPAGDCFRVAAEGSYSCESRHVASSWERMHRVLPMGVPSGAARSQPLGKASGIWEDPECSGRDQSVRSKKVTMKTLGV